MNEIDFVNREIRALLGREPERFGVVILGGSSIFSLLSRTRFTLFIGEKILEKALKDEQGKRKCRIQLAHELGCYLGWLKNGLKFSPSFFWKLKGFKGLVVGLKLQQRWDIVSGIKRELEIKADRQALQLLGKKSVLLLLQDIEDTERCLKEVKINLFQRLATKYILVSRKKALRGYLT